MIAKYWKKIGVIILIVACIFNIMSKLVHKLSLNKEMISSVMYILQDHEKINTEK